MKKAFTLAEIMIVLTVLGVLAGILVPIGIQSTPDKNVMKFKKADTTLKNAIRQLVQSDKYYKDGDLGMKPDGTLIDGTHSGDTTYLCNTMADILTTKETNCIEYGTTSAATVWYSPDEAWANENSWISTMEEAGIKLDDECKAVANSVPKEIITTDDIVYYQGNSKYVFGMSLYGQQELTGGEYCFGDEGAHVDYCKGKRDAYNDPDPQNFLTVHKIYCIDIDGIPDNVTAGNCVNECPFGYGIRVDGKIIMGARAKEWLDKSVQRGKDDN